MSSSAECAVSLVSPVLISNNDGGGVMLRTECGEWGKNQWSGS